MIIVLREFFIFFDTTELNKNLTESFTVAILKAASSD